MAEASGENDREVGRSKGPENGGASAPKARLKALLRSRKVQVALALAVVAVAVVLWWHFSFWESTDDAQIDGHLNQISSRVAGHVAKVSFEDNQFVKAGTVLVEIDPTDYRVSYERARAEREEAVAAAREAQEEVPVTSAGVASGVASARARVSNAEAGIVSARKELEAAQARAEQARAYNTKAQTDLRRYTALVKRDVISREQYDQITAAAKAAAAEVKAAEASAYAAKQKVNQAKGDLAQMQAELKSAQTAPQRIAAAQSHSESAAAAIKSADSALKQAELNLGYTTITAPVDGITGRKGVEVGQNVLPGQVLLYLVPVRDIWVTANFKENQLRKIRPGQRVRISVDAYRTKLDGYVESIGAASGSRFSLFPPENATGNYIKVVQRIPVRIRFAKGADPEHLLRPGMSVVPRVRVK